MSDPEHPKKPGGIRWERGIDGNVTPQGSSAAGGQTPDVSLGYPSPAQATWDTSHGSSRVITQSTWDIPRLLSGYPSSAQSTWDIPWLLLGYSSPAHGTWDIP